MIFIFLSCSKEDALKGSGNIITETREVADFTEIYNSTSVNLVIMEGSTQQVKLSVDDNVIHSIKTTVENGTLKIDFSKDNFIDVTIGVSLTMPTVDVLTNVGSGNITVSGFEDLSILAIENEGSGSITINGSGTALNLKNSGSGSYKGFGYVVQNCSVTNSGSGNCEVNCTASLESSNSGSGSVFFKGNATVEMSNTGSGEVVDSN